MSDEQRRGGYDGCAQFRFCKVEERADTKSVLDFTFESFNNANI